ncbi:hypothetical protein HYI36_05170 [Bacillus sp. Gen3]|nr:hypothetical protein [Bacillus sp. Gen3]
MDEKVKMIKDFCEGKITGNDLSEEVKKSMLDSGLINESGEFTKTGEAYRDAVNAKPIPGQKPFYSIRP